MALSSRVAVRRRAVGVAIAGVALCAWCGWASGFHRSTTASEITWACSLAVVVAVDVCLARGRRGLRPGLPLRPVAEPWPRPGCGGGRRALLGVSPWLLLLALAVAWDVLGLDSGPHQYHLTISALSQAYRPLNAVLLLVWILVGVGYEAARVRAPVRPAVATSARRQRAAPDSGPGALFGAVLMTGPAHGAAPGPALLLPPHPGLGVAFWVAVPVAGLAIDLVARRTGGRIATAEELVRFVSASVAVHVVLVVAWAFAGYHLFAR